MSKLNIIFNGTDYSIDEAALASAKDSLKTHLSTVMNGSGGEHIEVYVSSMGQSYTLAGLYQYFNDYVGDGQMNGNGILPTVLYEAVDAVPAIEDIPAEYLFPKVANYTEAWTGKCFILKSTGEPYIGVQGEGVLSVPYMISDGFRLPVTFTGFIDSLETIPSGNVVATMYVPASSPSTDGSIIITLDGTDYSVDPTKLSTATDNFVAHISTLTGGGLEPITWDGVVGDRVTAQAKNSESGMYVKVSDKILSADDLVGCTVTRNSGESISLDEDYAVIPAPGCVIIAMGQALSISDVSALPASCPAEFTETGTYFVYDVYDNGQLYLTSLTFPSSSTTGGNTAITIGGVDYMVDSANLDTAIANLHATLNRLSSGAGEDTPQN